MAGRGRLLLGPDFVHDEVEFTTPPVVGRVIEWPLPRTEYRTELVILSHYCTLVFTF